MKRAPRSLQHHVLYRKYNGQDSEISALLGKCGSKQHAETQISGEEKLFQCILSKINLDGPRVVRHEFRDNDVLEFTVSNRLTWPIAMIRFDYKIFSEGRRIPWSTGSDYLSFQGGLEPGETKTTTTFMPFYIPSEAPTPITIKYELTAVEGPDDQVVMSGRPLNSELLCE